MKTAVLFLFAWLAITVVHSQTVPAMAPDAGSPAAPVRPARPGSVDFAPELVQVTVDLKLKFDAGRLGGTNFDDNLGAITALIRRHVNDGQREEVARLYLLMAHIYADGLTNSAKARAVWNQVVRTYPGTAAARGAALSLARLTAQEEAALAAIPEGLEVGQRFPGFATVDINGSGFSLSAYRGRVTLVDFWATWCAPYREELPNILAVRQRFSPQDFAIVGVSLDTDRDTAAAFLKQQGMDWVQYFDGKAWDNELAVKYGVHVLPMNYLLDRRGIILGKSLRGEALGNAVAQALAN